MSKTITVCGDELNTFTAASFAALTGESQAGRAELVTEGVQANTVLRYENWVFLPAHDGPRYSGTTGNETGLSHWDQLYDLSIDISQQRNLAPERPDKVEQLRLRLEELRAAARTR